MKLKISLPSIKPPKLKLPKLKLPKLKPPKFKPPKLKLPAVNLPNVKLPKIKLPVVRIPRIRIPKIVLSTPMVIILALLTGAGVGGGVGYWFFYGRNAPSDVVKPPPDPYDLQVSVHKAPTAWTPKSLLDLEADSAYIVRGYLLPNARNELFYSEAMGQERHLQAGFTLSALVITESYKGPLLPGDKIPFVERYYYVYPEKEPVAENSEIAEGEEPIPEEEVEEPLPELFTINNYMPSVPKDEYVFFLSRQPVESSLFPGCYYLKCLELGRYPCLTAEQLLGGLESLDNKTLRLNVDTPEEDRAAYLGIFGEIIYVFTNLLGDQEAQEDVSAQDTPAQDVPA